MKHATLLLWSSTNGTRSNLRDGLIAYYKMNDATAQDRRDVSGNNRALTKDGTVTEAAGKVGSGAQFVAADGARLRSSNTAFNFGDEDFTLDFWLYIPDFDNDYPAPIGKWGTGAGSYVLQLGQSEDEWWWAVSSDGTSATSMSLGTGVPLGEWTHVMLAHDSVNNLLIARINHGTPITQSYSAGVHSSPTVPFAVGKGNQDYNGSFASCIADELGVWGRMLTEAEQDQRWNGGSGSTIDAPITFDSSGEPTLFDDFNSFNGAVWNNVSPFFDPVRGGTGNNGAGGPNPLELQAFVSSAVSVSGGNLVLTQSDVSGSPVLGMDFTAGMATTFGKFHQQYGRFQARIKIPDGSGFHSCFWLMRDDLISWPPEIDVLEISGLRPKEVYESLHWQQGDENLVDEHESFLVNINTDFSADFHTYEVDWNAERVIWYIDGVEYNRMTEHVPTGAMAIILSVHMGNDFSGPVTAPLPDVMLVDFVKVWA